MTETLSIETSISPINEENKKYIEWSFADGWNPKYDNNKHLWGKLGDYENKFNFDKLRSASINWKTNRADLSVFTLKYKNLLDEHYDIEFRYNEDKKCFNMSKIYEVVDVFYQKECLFEIPSVNVKTIREAMVFCLLYFQYYDF